MASLKYRDKNGTMHSLSGAAYENDIDGTKKLYVRTGTNPNDKLTYGIAIASSASEYSPLRFKHDDTPSFIGRKETHYTYSTNSKSYTDDLEVVNTTPNPSLNENLYSTSSHPQNYWSHTSSLASRTGGQYSNTLTFLPSGFPTTTTSSISRENTYWYSRYYVSSVRSGGGYYSTKSHSYNSYYTQSTAGTGSKYWSGSSGAWNYSGSTTMSSPSAGVSINYDDYWYNYNWTLSTRNNINWYYVGTGSKGHNSSSTLPDYRAGNYYRISATMVDWWTNSADGWLVNYTRSARTQSRKSFTISYYVEDYYLNKPKLYATTRGITSNSYYTRTTASSRQTYVQVDVSSNSSAMQNWIDSKNTLVNSTTYSSWHGIQSVLMTVNHATQAYALTSYCGNQEAYSTYSYSETNNTSSRSTYYDGSDSTPDGWKVSHSANFSKSMYSSYTTKSSTKTTINNSTYTTADVTQSLLTHNFV